MYGTSTPGGFPPKVTYGIHIPILVLNIIVLGGLSWDLSPASRNVLKFYGANVYTGLGALVTTILCTLWTLTLLITTKQAVRLPHLLRIIAGAFTTILYLAGCITLGILMRNDFLFNPSYGRCNARAWSRAQCEQFWYAHAGIQIIAIAFGLVSLILTIVDIIVAVRVKRRDKKVKDEEGFTGGHFAY